MLSRAVMACFHLCSSNVRIRTSLWAVSLRRRCQDNGQPRSMPSDDDDDDDNDDNDDDDDNNDNDNNNNDNNDNNNNNNSNNNRQQR